MIRTVVAAASVAAIVIDAIVPALKAIIVYAVVPPVMAHLMLALVMVRRIIAAAARLSDGWDRDRTADGKRGQNLRVAGVHVGDSS